MKKIFHVATVQGVPGRQLEACRYVLGKSASLVEDGRLRADLPVWGRRVKGAPRLVRRAVRTTKR